MDTARIMIVEDEAIVAASLEDHLESMGYTVCGMASSGEDAVSLAAEQAPDLILMDIRLRGEMDGIDAAEAIRVNKPIPVVFMTAYAETETLERAKATEPYGYLVKPVQPREVRSTVEMALAKAKLTAEKEALIKELQGALREVRRLSGLLPICANCKKIRDDKGYWRQVEDYIRSHSDADFSHSICPECAEELYPEFCDGLE